MIQYVARVDTKREASGFRKPDLLLKIGIEVPASGPVNGPQTERSQLARRCIPQDEIRPCLIGGDGAVGAETSQVCRAPCRDTQTSRICHSVERLREVIPEVGISPNDLTIARELADDVGGTGSVDRVSGFDVQRGSCRRAENRTELPAFDQTRNDA